VPATLVIGATGILRPAAHHLLQHGVDVVAVGRDPARFDALREATADTPGTLIELPADAASRSFADELDALLLRDSTTLSDVLAYAPATTVAVLTALSVDGAIPTVEVVTSAVARPGGPDRPWTLGDLPERPWRRLVLGWWYRDGVPTWHDADQISAAALAVRDGTGDHLLGSVTPWSDRPT